MKRCIVWLVSFCSIMPVSHVLSQSGILDSARYIHQAWLSQERKAVLTTIGLTEFEKASFWPVYEAYCRAKEYLELEYLNIMLVYSEYLNTYNQTYAERLYRLLLNNDYELAKIRLKSYKQIRRALPISKANAFMRLDNSASLEIQSPSSADQRF